MEKVKEGEEERGKEKEVDAAEVTLEESESLIERKINEEDLVENGVQYPKGGSICDICGKKGCASFKIVSPRFFLAATDRSRVLTGKLAPNMILQGPLSHSSSFLLYFLSFEFFLRSNFFRITFRPLLPLACSLSFISLSQLSHDRNGPLFGFPLSLPSPLPSSLHPPIFPFHSFPLPIFSLFLYTRSIGSAKRKSSAKRSSHSQESCNRS